ncbi:MAG: methylated-DNA--[protein]-cysteine S-methyltransferase [Planctomycetota bacterium]
MDSPLGVVELRVGADPATGTRGLASVRCLAADEETRPFPSGGLLADAAEQLAAYFAGDLQRFDLPLTPKGTPFQRRVWDALLEIPFGVTTSYGAIAQEIGQPGAAIAVGRANGANPLWIVVPCHRVIGTDGKLHGYAGGLDRKRWLLEHEGALTRVSNEGSAVTPTLWA